MGIFESVRGLALRISGLGLRVISGLRFRAFGVWGAVRRQEE